MGGNKIKSVLPTHPTAKSSQSPGHSETQYTAASTAALRWENPLAKKLLITPSCFCLLCFLPFAKTSRSAFCELTFSLCLPPCYAHTPTPTLVFLSLSCNCLFFFSKTNPAAQQEKKKAYRRKKKKTKKTCSRKPIYSFSAGRGGGVKSMRTATCF